MLAAPHGLQDRDVQVLLLERRQHLLQEFPAFEKNIGVVKQGVRVQSGCMPRCTPQSNCKSQGRPVLCLHLGRVRQASQGVHIHYAASKHVRPASTWLRASCHPSRSNLE